MCDDHEFSMVCTWSVWRYKLIDYHKEASEEKKKAGGGAGIFYFIELKGIKT